MSLILNENEAVNTEPTMSSANIRAPKKRKNGAGGKLNRCKIIQSRINPSLHAAAEIMARNHRRTLSSFIEMLIEAEAIKCHFDIETPVT